MFDKLKDLSQLKKVQDEMKKQLENIFITEESRGLKIVLRGDKRVERIEFDGVENKELKDLLNKANKEVDKKVAKQMKGSLQDLGFPGL